MCSRSHFERPEQYLLLAMQRLGPLYPSQLRRLLQEGLHLWDLDLMRHLTTLKDAGLTEQVYDLQGLRYRLTAAGAQAVRPLPQSEAETFEEQVGQYAAIFKKEEDYLAQYTEQANCVFPVFLSIRRGEAIVFHLDLVVETEEEARRLTQEWPQCAEKTFDAVWECLAPGQRRPGGTEK